jgi:hypothetical protein
MSRKRRKGENKPAVATSWREKKNQRDAGMACESKEQVDAHC